MIRMVLTALIATFAVDAQASTDTCHISGTAYDYSGHPLPAAVIRLTDLQTHQTEFRAADASAAFAFSDLAQDASGQRYRLDILSPAVIVTGTHIRTRSVLGIAPSFACGASRNARVDVRVEAR